MYGGILLIIFYCDDGIGVSPRRIHAMPADSWDGISQIFDFPVPKCFAEWD